jgi:hypothetical protein
MDGDMTIAMVTEAARRKNSKQNGAILTGSCYGSKEWVCDRLHSLRYARRGAGIRGTEVTH